MKRFSMCALIAMGAGCHGGGSNHAPSLDDVALSTLEDTPLVVARDILDPFDPDRDGLTVTLSTPRHGVVTGTGPWTYRPSPDFAGVDEVLATVSDGALSATATVTITIEPVNDAPTAVADRFAASPDGALTIAQRTLIANDRDIDSPALSIATVGLPQGGSVAISGDDIVFTPDPAFTGLAGFSYTLSDGALTAPSTVTVAVGLANAPPITGADALAVDEDSSVTVADVALLANDVDPDGDSLAVVDVFDPVNGTVERAGPAITFTPRPDAFGQGRFGYLVTDGVATGSGTVTVAVNGINDAPIAIDDEQWTMEDLPLVISAADLTAYDVDADGDPLVVVAVASPVNGTVSLAGDLITFTPAPDFSGTASFAYVVSDGSATATATVTVHCGPVNDPPSAGEDRITTAEDVPAVVTAAVLLGNDRDPDGDALRITAVRNPIAGTVSLVGSTVTFTPSANFFGQGRFDYVITDGVASTTGRAIVTITSVNDAPVAAADAVATNEDTILNLAVGILLANDVDVDSKPLVLASVRTPVNGTVSINGGVVRFVPAPNVSGTGSFVYVVSDGALTSTALVTVTIAPVNDAPVAVADAVTVPGGAATAIPAATLLANDTDVENGPLSIAAVSAAVNGTVSLAADVVTFTPAPGHVGLAGFSYTLTDGSLTSTGTVAVTVVDSNDAPVAVDDVATTHEDVVLSLAGATLVGNDQDADGDPLAVVSVGQASQGSVVLVGGQVQFTPARDFAGTATFEYVVSDGEETDVGLVSIDVLPVNDAPAAVADAVETAEDAALVLPATALTANDVDLDDDALSVIAVQAATDGAVVLQGGEIVFTPAPDFHGTAGFQYVISDGATSAVATVAVTVRPVNDAPVAVADALAAGEDAVAETSAAALLANDSDVDGDALAVVEVHDATHGSVALTGDTVAFTPAADFHGVASFSYTISDGSTSAVGTVSVTVAPANDPPVATGDAATTAEDTAVVIATGDLLGNDLDVDGDALTVTAVGDATGGTVALGDAGVVFTPTADVAGAASFSYTVSDGTATATATVAVTVTAVNDAPAADGFTATTAEDTAVSIDAGALVALGSDVDGDALSVVAVEGAVSGSVVLADGVITFTPAADFHGLASFDYQLSDGAAFAVASVVVTVTPVNDAPVAVGDAAATAEDTAVAIATGDLLGNDSDVEGDALAVTAVGDATGGTVALGDAGVVFTPTANFAGAASFSYTISDGAASSIATVAVTVTAVNDAPVAAGDAAQTAEDTALTLATGVLLANDSDVDNDALAVTAVGEAVNGTVALGDAGVVFTPTADFHGNAAFTYTVSDGTASATAVVALVVTAVNDAPVAAGDAAQTAEDVAVAIETSALLANDGDLDGDALAVVAVGDAVGGTVALAAGVVTFAPAPDTSGAASFRYTISDGELTAVATVAVAVAPVNDAPVAVDDAAGTAEDAALTVAAGDLLGNDDDVDDDALTVTAVGEAVNGTVALGDAGIVFTPAPDFHGAASFAYEISDGAATARAVVAVTVTPVNDAPVATADAAETAEDTAVAIAAAGLLGNDGDIDSDALAVTAVGGAEHGTVSLAGATVTFAPAADFHGTARFTYTVSDGELTATGEVAVTVTPVNDAPVADDDEVEVAEDAIGRYPAELLLAGDRDVDGDALRVVAVDKATHGTVSLDGELVVFTPEPDFHGVAGFEYVVSDGTLADVAAVTVVVTPVNDAPVAADDRFVLLEDADLRLTAADLLGNDRDIDGDALAVADLRDVRNGTARIDGSGVLFVPDANFFGPASFVYVVSDGAATASALVTIDVLAVNDAPDLAPDVAQTAEDTALQVTAAALLANDTDVDGDPLRISAVRASSPATVVLVDGVVTYTPGADVNGPASFEYVVSDGTTSVVSSVAVTITPVNDAPVAVADDLATPEDAPLVIATTAVTGNDIDVDGDALTVTAVRAPVNGTVALVGGTITFTPAANFSGTGRFEYVVSDGQATSAALATVAVSAVNDAPVAVDDARTGFEDAQIVITAASLLANDTDIEANPLTIVAVQAAVSGTVTLTGTSITFVGSPNYVGPARFDYVVSDGNATDVGTVTVNLLGVNDAPVAVNDAFEIAEDTQLVVTYEQLLANDSDVDGNNLSINSVNTPINGTVSRSNGIITFTPRANFSGAARFDYQVSDGTTSVPGRVFVTVAAVNDAPIPVPDAVTTAEDTPVTIAVATLLANDTDVDGALTVTGVRNPSHGSVALVGTQVNFVPAANFTGIASFEYVVSDGTVEVGALVTVTVTAVNDPPVVSAVAAVTVANIAVAVVLTAVDPDGDALTFQVASQPGHGTLLGLPPLLTYLPAAGFTGTDAFTYRASDGTLTSAPATATITVNLGAAAVCGNLRVEAEEACDDGNQVTGDGCDANCTPTGCGNGEVGGFAATAVTFEWLGTSCAAAEISFSVGDTVVHREELSKACGCDAGVASATIDDPAVLELLEGDTTLSVAITGEDGALAWAIATVEVGAGGREVVLFDEGGGGDAELRAADLCVAGYTGATAASAVSELVEECDDGNDQDGDGCSAACLVELAAEPAAP